MIDEKNVLLNFFDDEISGCDMIDVTSEPPISKSDVERVIQLIKNGKAIGPEQANTETLKLCGDKGLTALQNYLMLCT